MKLIIFAIILLYILQTSARKIQTRVYNGKISNRMLFPYQVRLDMKRKDGPKYDTYQCGGTLISNQHVLTAAHCFFNRAEKKTFKHITVILGDVDISSKSDKKRQEFVISFDHDVVVHEGFKKESRSMDNDIAIITLPEKVQFNAFIKAAKLPRQSESNLVGKSVVVSGWGKNGDKSTKEVKHLLHNVLEIVPDSDCQHTKQYKKRYAPGLQLCVKGKNTGACTGDSGGPYVLIEENSLPKVVGIVSFGSYYCEDDHPDIMTNVHHYLDWIHSHTGIKILP